MLIDLACAVPGVGLALWEHRRLADEDPLLPIGLVPYEPWEEWVSYSSLGLTLVYAITFVLTLKWFFRVNANARALAHGPLRVSPLGAVLWQFAPVVSIWKTWLAFRQSWQASVRPEDWRRATTPRLLYVWWILFGIAHVDGLRGFWLALRVETVAELRAYELMLIGSYLLSAPLTVVLIVLVRRLSDLQWRNVQIREF